MPCFSLSLIFCSPEIAKIQITPLRRRQRTRGKRETVRGAAWWYPKVFPHSPALHLAGSESPSPGHTLTRHTVIYTLSCPDACAESSRTLHITMGIYSNPRRAWNETTRL